MHRPGLATDSTWPLTTASPPPPPNFHCWFGLPVHIEATTAAPPPPLPVIQFPDMADVMVLLPGLKVQAPFQSHKLLSAPLGIPLQP